MDITAVLWTSSCYTYIVNQGYIKIHLTTSKSVDMKSIKYPNITSHKQNGH
jgi:hypothetical protein